MTLPTSLRKLSLTLHVVCSVGWLGAVAAFLVLAIGALSQDDSRLVGAAYLASERLTWNLIVPLSFASLVSGIVQSLGTSWGLFRHYWVVAKLFLNVAATGLLLLHTQPITRVARAAAESTLSGDHLRPLRTQLVFDASAAVVALVIATALSVYKPWGLTPYGIRKLSGSLSSRQTVAAPRWVYVSAIAIVLFLVAVVMLHLTGHSPGAH